MNTRGLFVVIATVVALLLAAGCGSSGDAEVTVQTGSLSKAEFIKKADAICEAARTEFEASYAQLLAKHKSEFEKEKVDEKAVLAEIVESVVSPNFEKEIKQISELGAPSDYAPEVEAFLNTLQKQLQEVEGEPAKASSTAFPFKKTEDAAKKAGMNGCAESFG